jgi:hypothetical protein
MVRVFLSSIAIFVINPAGKKEYHHIFYRNTNENTDQRESPIKIDEEKQVKRHHG